MIVVAALAIVLLLGIVIWQAMKVGFNAADIAGHDLAGEDPCEASVKGMNRSTVGMLVSTVGLLVVVALVLL